MLNHIALITILTDDVPRLAAFYHDALGFAIKQDLGGHRFELAFPCDSPADVDRAYADILTKGATPVHAPGDMPWGQRTAMVADPDGNIHELFADLPQK